jgi:hypothetical protein
MRSITASASLACIWPLPTGFRHDDKGVMHVMRYPLLLGLMGMLATGGCVSEGDAAADEGPAARRAEARTPAPTPPPPPPTEADSAAARTRVASRAQAVRTAFGRVKALGAREVGNLRLDKNATQVAVARRLGTPAAGESEIRRLVREGRLVALGDSTEWWVLRDMDHSTPYVTPDARAMLMELGRRFHARLDSAGLPRYRMKVTSALRTADTQEDLRKINSYASMTTSAHQFGTTVDVSHERFAVPADTGDVFWALESDTLEEIGKEHSKAMQALLGRAIVSMRAEGILFVMMENKQPVYHFTLARPFARRR